MIKTDASKGAQSGCGPRIRPGSITDEAKTPPYLGRTAAGGGRPWLYDDQGTLHPRRTARGPVWLFSTRMGANP